MDGIVVEIAEITNVQKDRMYELMESYFEGVTRQVFGSDLEDKQWVVLLRDSDSLCGFSTLSLTEEIVSGQRVRAFFSGDTIVDREHWGSMALEEAWARFVFSQVTTDPTCRWFWFLICKGYRTYRYLPVYFKRFYPSANQPTPTFEQAVLDQLAQKRYGLYYNARAGTIQRPDDYRLRSGVGDIGERQLRDPRIALFQKMNPHWRQGIELASIAELSLDNVTKVAFRFLQGDSES